MRLHNCNANNNGNATCMQQQQQQQQQQQPCNIAKFPPPLQKLQQFSLAIRCSLQDHLLSKKSSQDIHRSQHSPN